ncbi:MAG: hypothetical protein AB7Q97_07775 [Gammaproteobacteria bacterium]
MSTERRAGRRIHRRLHLTIGNFDAWTTNVSASGLQIAIPIADLPRFRQALREERFHAAVDVPDAGAIAIEGQVRYISDHGDEFLAGVLIEHIEGGTAAWADFIGSLGAA